jgi:hypothetical protein
MQRYTIFFIAVNALHVSGGFSAHHQELRIPNCKHIWYMSSLLVAAARGCIWGQTVASKRWALTAVWRGLISQKNGIFWYVLTYLLTPRSRVLLEKLTGFAASQEIPRIYGTRQFSTVLTSARQLSLSWARSIRSAQPPPTSWRSILILSSHLRLGLPNGLFPSGFPTKIYYYTLYIYIYTHTHC